MSEKKDFSALLKEGGLPERQVDICLRGALVAEFEAADQALTLAMKTPSTNKEDPGVSDLVERIEAIQAEMRDSTYTFRIRALDNAGYSELEAAHPARDGDEADAVLRFNRDTFFPALLKASIYDPALTAEEWTELLTKLTDRQYGELTDAAWFANRDKVSVPFSQAALLARRNTAEE